ncbi:HAD family hydrolase [Isoptericola sp. NEAU-Y5]|uniref:HAD family hydrolase n=1 Tax=Isoptericola luteus TaxID=2879484 RepID=A0ABS7ZAA6_9MICO|nr:HAD family hydrolase [Isoptericola sp. NEAU-Y5]MCA5891823.1 HAD family hydrolase [Isoptericola sp. NEAU-Y5]
MTFGVSVGPADGHPQAASFDIWLTLIRSNPGFKAARNTLIQSVVAPDTEADTFARALRAADVRADRLAEATGTDQDLGDRVRLALQELGRATDALGDETVAELRRRQHDLALDLLPVALDPALPELLTDLSSTIPLAITSNTGMIPGATMRALLDGVGLLAPFAVRVFSDEVGVAKPGAAIFEATLRGLRDHAPGLERAGVVHVGDNPVADDGGARSAGMGSLLVGDALTTVDAVVHLLDAVRGTTDRLVAPGGAR